MCGVEKIIVSLQIIELLNEANISTLETVKVTNLSKLQEILLNKEPQLLHKYLDDFVQFSIDRNSEVRKVVTGFIEEIGYVYYV